jgi:quinol monooxygenase YgiN
MAEHASVIRIARYRPSADKRDELVHRLEDGVERLRQMEGCFGAQVCVARESPDTIAVISRWASQSAVDQFLQATTTLRAEADQLAMATTEHFTPL